VIAPPAATPAAPPEPEVIEVTLLEPLGYDPQTGQILDPAAYANWQRAQQQQRAKENQAQPGLSVYEVFLAARKTLQDWVDADANKPFVISASPEALRQHPELQGLVRVYQGYGQVMLDKLWKHLDFLVENRRKFHAAFG